MQQASDQAVEKATKQTLVSIERLSGDLFIFRVTRPENYRFVPGQYSRLGLPDGAGMVWRPFSVTSAPQDDLLEYYGVQVPNGLFTGMLAKLEPGAPIWIDKQVFGFMTADRFSDGEDLWMLSTGTGIGPFISMLRDAAVWRQFRRIVIAHGVKRVGDLAFREVLRTMQNQPSLENGATLHMVEAVTRDQELEPCMLGGRLTSLLANGSLERTTGIAITPEASRFMMCGNPAMIEDMRKELHQRGMRPCRRALPGQFVTENYW
ncbi:MAG TPA: ferredoxin--NADP reductase [Burkholderiaceae bacterium]